MKGDAEVVKVLNQILTGELTAINQYILHSRILKDQGHEKLGQFEFKSSLEEMKHADIVIQRILFLEGHPNLQVLNKLRIGKTIKEMLEADLALEHEAIHKLKAGIKITEEKEDFVTRDLLKEILIAEEHHVDWLETQLSLIDSTGEANYAQSQIMMEESYKDDGYKG